MSDQHDQMASVSQAYLDKLEADNARLRALLEEARRLVFFSAKDLRRVEGEDSVLCELVEEEQFVKDATDVLGPMPEVYR